MASHTASIPSTHASTAQKLRQIRDYIKRNLHIILPVVSIFLILVGGYLVYKVYTETFLHEFRCTHVVDHTLFGKDPGDGDFSLCKDIVFSVGPYEIIKSFSIGPLVIPTLTYQGFSVTLLKDGLKPINGPLEGLRKFVVSNILLTFAVVSLVLAFVTIKIKNFVKLIVTPEGRKTLLTNLSIYLLFFAVLCSLFYFGVVVNR